MVDDLTFLCAWMATIAGFITPVWCGLLHLIRLWGDRRDQMPKPARQVRHCLCGYQSQDCHCGVEN